MSGHVPLPAAPIDLPLLPLRDVVVFPHMVIPLFVGRPKSIKALEAAMEAERRIMLVAQKAAAKDEPSVSDMFEVGCVSTILQMLKLPDGTVKVLVEGQQRARVNRIEDGDPSGAGQLLELLQGVFGLLPGLLRDGDENRPLPRRRNFAGLGGHRLLQLPFQV